MIGEFDGKPCWDCSAPITYIGQKSGHETYICSNPNCRKIYREKDAAVLKRGGVPCRRNS